MWQLAWCRDPRVRQVGGRAAVPLLCLACLREAPVAPARQTVCTERPDQQPDIISTSLLPAISHTPPPARPLPQVLTDPTFIERSGPTLTNLTNVPLWRGADLTPFTALKVLMVLAPDRDADEAAEALAPPAAGGGAVMGVGGGGGSDGEEEAEAAAQGMQVQEALLHSLRLPEGLESLCLSAENVESEHDFLAGAQRQRRAATLCVHGSAPAGRKRRRVPPATFACLLRCVLRCPPGPCLQGPAPLSVPAAEWLPLLPRLQELGLFSYRSYDLRGLPATVTCVRISNPRLGAGEVVGGPGYNFPQWPPASRSSSSSSSSNGSSESEAAGPGQAEAGRTEAVAEQLGRLAVSRSSSGASFESAQSELSLRAPLPGEAPSSSGSVQQAEAGGGDGSRAGAEEGSGAGAADSTPCEAAEPAAQRAGSGASKPGTPATSELVPAPAPAGEGGTSSSGAGGGPGPGPRRRGPAHHHHRDLPGEGRGSSPEPQEGDHQCTDPNCPLHSGKRFLQLSFTDHREHAAVDLSAMVASRAHMVTVACGAGAAPGPPAEGGGAPTALELRHTGSLAELLQEMEAAGGKPGAGLWAAARLRAASMGFACRPVTLPLCWDSLHPLPGTAPRASAFCA